MAADKPLVMGQNLLRDASSIVWIDGVTGGSPRVDASYPLSRLHDSYTDLLTKASGSYNVLRVAIDFGAAGVEFDSVAVIAHDAFSVGGYAMRVFVADDLNNTVNSSEIAYHGLSADTRQAWTILKHTGSTPLRYSSVRYAFVVFYAVAPKLYSVGEIIFARRRQLKTNPFGAWDTNHLRTRAAVTASPSGIKTVHVRSKGERILRATMRPHETDRVDDLLALWEADTDYGTYPFVWIDQPTTAPERAALMRWDMLERTSMYLGPYQREIPIQASEQGPHYVELDP